MATDLDGAFRLELTPGVHMLVCSFIGMADQRKELTLSVGQESPGTGDGFCRRGVGLGGRIGRAV